MRIQCHGHRRVSSTVLDNLRYIVQEPLTLLAVVSTTLARLRLDPGPALTVNRPGNTTDTSTAVSHRASHKLAHIEHA